MASRAGLKTDERVAHPMPAWPTPVGGWPPWVWLAPYDGSNHPLSRPVRPVVEGANCQRYAYAVLELFGRDVPPLRSSDLWTSRVLTQVPTALLRPLDLVLFSAGDTPYGAHVGVLMPDEEVLHLCAEVARPAVWSLSAFARRRRYASALGGLRVSSG